MFVFVIDEDVHQCGRCKEIFSSIDEYFVHKKAKACQKVKSGTKLETPPRSTPNHTQFPPDGISVGVLVSEKAAYEEILSVSRTESVTSSPAFRGRGRQRKSAPKKVWVQHYENEEIGLGVEVNQKEDTHKVEALPHVLVPKRQRGRPRKGEASLFPPKNSPRPVIKRGRGGRQGRPPGRGRGTNHGRSSGGHDSACSKEFEEIEQNCPICDYSAVFHDEFDRHLRRVHKLSRYVCQKCGTAFRDKYKLQCHQTNERCPKLRSEPPYKPNYAVFSKRSQSIRIEHLGALEPEQLEDREQKVPSMRLRKKLSFKKHMKDMGCDSDRSDDDDFKEEKWDGVANFKCFECDTNFDSYETVKGHVSDEHKNMHPGICPFCGKWFLSKYKLWRHVASSVHDSISDAVLIQARGEIMMSKVHMTDTESQYMARLRNKHYACEQCDQKFNKKNQLNNHMLTMHKPAKEIKFRCESCGEGFWKRSHFTRHLLTEHGIDPVTDREDCPTCHKKFKQKNHVFRHIDSLHSPVSQAPLEELYNLEGDEPDCSTVDNISGVPYSCFICCRQIASKAKLEAHHQLHRQWVMVNDEGYVMDGIEVLYDKLFARDPMLGLLKLEANKETNHSHQSTEQPESPINPDSVIISKIIPVTGSNETKAAVEQEPSEPEPEQSENQTMTTIDQSALRDLVQQQNVLNILQEMGSQISPAVPSGEPGHIQPQTMPSMPTELTLDSDQQPMTMLTHEANVLQSGDIKVTLLDSEHVQNNEEEEDSQQHFLPILMPPMPIPSPRNDSPIDTQLHTPKPNTNNEEKETSLKDDASVSLIEEDSDGGVCPYCLKTFSTLKDMYLHKVNDHSLILVFKCTKTECKMVFHKLKELKEHAKEHSQFAFICRSCNEHFDEMLKVIAHKSSAHRTKGLGEWNCRCTICNQTFESRKMLKEHLNAGVHGSFLCTDCDLVFASQTGLHDHILTHVVVKSFLCDLCGTTFGTRLQLNRHRSIHAATKSHLCTQCDSAFNKKEHLRRHVITKHSQEKPFACKQPGCNKAFNRKDKLQEHYKTHTDIKPFVCQICSKSYRYREGLKYHEKTHQRELKFFCTICEMGFIKPGMLRNHMTESHGLNLKKNFSYPCNKCGHIFARPERLKRHIEREHGVNSDWKFHCQMCNKGFPGYRSLTTHMKRRHFVNETGEAQSTGDAAAAEKKKQKDVGRDEEMEVAVGAAASALIQAANAVVSTSQLSQAAAVEMVRIVPGSDTFATAMQLSNLPTLSPVILTSSGHLQPMQPAIHSSLPHSEAQTVNMSTSQHNTSAIIENAITVANQVHQSANDMHPMPGMTPITTTQGQQFPHITAYSTYTTYDSQY